MKKGNKLVCAALSCIMLAGTFVGCSKGSKPTESASSVWGVRIVR